MNQFFVSFIIALCKVQTVCFNNLAQGFDGKANWIFLRPCLQHMPFFAIKVLMNSPPPSASPSLGKRGD